MEINTQYITPKQVATMLQIGHRQATNLVKKLPTAVKIGNEWRATEIAFTRYIDALSKANNSTDDTDSGQPPLRPRYKDF